VHAPAAAKQLSRFFGQDAGTLETLPEPGLALGVAGRELVLPTAFGELLLVVEQICLVDRYATLAASRHAARLDDTTGFVPLAGPVRRGDLDALTARFSLFAPTERDTEQHHRAE
jgi:hypothetical protein